MRILLLLLLAAMAACETSDARPSGASGSEVAVTAPGDEDVRARRVWAQSGDYGVPSPDGRLVTFVDWSTGDVAVHDLATGESRRVTDKGHWIDNGSWAEEPLFSPDGDEIVYTYGDVQAGVNPFVYQLRIVGADGSADRVLFQFPDAQGWISPEDWRADRGILARVFPGPQRGSRLAVISPDDGSVEELRTFSASEPGPHEASFSPDGRFVAYRAGRELRLLAVASGAERMMGVPTRAVMGWYPDGGGVLVHTARDGVSGFWRIPVRDGAPDGAPELVRGGIPVAVPGGQAEGRFFYHIPVDGPKLHLASIDVEGGRVLSEPAAVTTVADGWARDPAWSPDGRWLAYFLRDQDQDVRLMLRSADGDRSMELAEVGRSRNVTNLTWTPDGSALHFTQRGSGDPSTLRRADARTGEMTEIFRSRMAHAFLTPDGTRAVLVREAHDGDPTASGVVVRDLATGEERTVHEDVTNALSLSPDGRTLAMVTGGGRAADRHVSQVVLLPLEGGEPRVLASTTHPEHWEFNQYRLPWTPDGRHLLVVHGGWEGIPHHLMAVPVDGGEPRRFFRTPGSRIYPDIHPDGQRVAFIDGEARSEMWVLEEID